MRLKRDFSLHWKNYLILFLVVELSLEVAIIPLFNAWTSLLLNLGAIPYLSYTNALSLVTSHPYITLGLLLELIILIICVFGQFALILNGVVLIRQDEFSFRAILKNTARQLRQLDPLGIFFFAGYFLLIVPFSGIFFNSPLLSKIVIPEFILDFLLQKPLYATLLGIFYLAIFILSIRLLFVLPLMLFEKVKIKAALAQSWQLTRNKFWAYTLKLLKISFIALITNLGLIGILYSIQLGLDQNPLSALIGGSINVTLLQIGSFLISVWASVALLQLILPADVTLATYKSTKKSWLSKIAKPLFALFTLGALLGNGAYLVHLGQTPLIISHRGVDAKNGVQNTIPALRKTAQAKPNYIEIDIQETKDHKFVVMHDENLKQLADLDTSPQELTLAQLTALTVHENGHQAKIPSFDEYLSVAKQYEQRLLVEIKTTKRDSKNMLKNFFDTYKTTLKQNNHELQSLDYKVITSAKKYAPTLNAYYILPYNFIFPQTPANGYTMEKTTLNDSFVTQAKLSFKKVYSWTVNSEEDLKKAAFLDVDGIITDNVTEAKWVYHNFNANTSYANRLLDAVILLPE
ncbi:glycerophosphoryl diester phosphodiesterase [Ligilactobacillus murinus DSM 20452 = NBRC 14221]|uniref:Glycerophosphoryl diester phosphodiesterase n=1 Tax=Ligilactobacillus murinus DSM 20452 = NBRC 14221 TaxID=1423772 RepID=A0A0R2B452_9LACO|nr:glycerophosphodiester phosphodiesterase [Ligilactobacillus murinus]KRM74302.1 glycerophosphoryl diester phosphodiesterase [Ligilactobacillus murinus DSM 20452 = NBRC 14221]